MSCPFTLLFLTAAKATGHCRKFGSKSSPSAISRSLANRTNVAHPCRLSKYKRLSTISKKNACIISYLTDVEGDYHYLRRFVENSKILTFSKTVPDRIEFKPALRTGGTTKNSMLVFGGDVWDKAGCDLRVLSMLLSLKDRHGDRVRFILGNRDVNKLRIWGELTADEHKGVFWLQGTGRIGNRSSNKDVPGNSAERLKWMLGRTMGSPNAFELRRKELARNERSRVTNVKSSSVVTDEEVVQSYLETCSVNQKDEQEGLMIQYISRAKAMDRIGNCLFLHGALPPFTTASLTSPAAMSRDDYNWSDYFQHCLPWIQQNNQKHKQQVANIKDWMKALNDMVQSQLRQWKQQQTHHQSQPQPQSLPNTTVNNWSTNGGYNNLPGSKLMQYGMGWLPNKARNPTVIYNSWLTQDPTDGKTSILPTQLYPPELLSDFLCRADLQCILTGHKPIGDLPLPIRVDHKRTTTDSSKWIMACDTSYSGDVKWIHDQRTSLGRSLDNDTNSANARGKVVCEVLMGQDPKGNITKLVTHGTLSDGSVYTSTNLMDDTVSNCIGTTLTTHDVLSGMSNESRSLLEDVISKDKCVLSWQVKLKLDDGRYLVSAYQGFNVWNAITMID